VIEDEKAIEVVIRLEEEAAYANRSIGRRMTVRTIATRSQGDADYDVAISPMERIVMQTHHTINEPEPVHARSDTRALDREGIVAKDYFFGRQEVAFQQVKPEEEKNKSRRKTSFSAWCQG
jgi:hypothetical protein